MYIWGREDLKSQYSRLPNQTIMALVDLIMPKLGESIMEATVLKWHKQPGDTVKMDETVLEIATDKVDSEVPSTVAGVIEEILFNVNDVVPIGTVIARIRTGAAEPATSTPVLSTPPKEAVTQPVQEAVVVASSQLQTANQPTGQTGYNPQTNNGSSNRFYSPLVLNIAASEGVSMTELENIPGTGNEGRVTKKDILQFVSQRKTGNTRPEARSQNETMVIPVSKVEQQQTNSNHGNNIIIKKDINIGMATALPSGNLIVPVIKNADQLNLVGLTKQVNGLADAARNGKLKVDDTSGGTFTLTNVGTFGSLMGTPIINQPQVAIMAVGAIKKRPVVIETPAGDSIAIRHMMYLSMSYDHRIVDGSLGATFLTAVAKELENFKSDREF